MTQILDKAKTAVDSDRQSQYGDPVENAELQAQVASIIAGKPIDALLCNAVNLAQKIVRMGRSDKEDTMIDVAGYTEIRARLVAKQKAQPILYEPFPKKVSFLECIFCTKEAIHSAIYCDDHVDGYSKVASDRVTSDGELTPRPKNVSL